MSRKNGWTAWIKDKYVTLGPKEFTQYAIAIRVLLTATWSNSNPHQSSRPRVRRMFLRRMMVASPLLAKLKETTGIVGLDVVPNAREVLISLYTRTLQEIKAVPEDEGYRKAVESFTNHRLRICQEEGDWEQIEKKIGCGQVEELIEEAQDELKLIAKMIEWDPWGVPEGYECEVIENDAPIPKHVPQHRPAPLPEEFYKTLEAVMSTPAAAKKDELPSTSSSQLKE